MENPFEISEIPEKAPKEEVWRPENNSNDSLSPLNSIGSGKVDSLKETVEEIHDMIKEREDLSNTFIREAEGLKTNINNFLLESAPKGEEDSEFVRERSELRKKQIELSEIQLNEKVGCWRDIAMLKRELRERDAELSQKESRTEQIRRILE